MTDFLSEGRARFARLRSSAPFWSLRYHAESREFLAVRQDTIEPPRFSIDRGAMLSAMTESGYGYCATSDLSSEGLQAALDKATAWAQATRKRSAVRYDPATMAAPRGAFETAADPKRLGRSAIFDLLAEECRRAKLDARIVSRYAALDLVEEERVYYTNTGGELRQRFRFTLPYAHASANAGVETQTRSLSHAQQGGFEQIERSGLVGSGARLAEDALQLLLAPNCPEGTMDVLLMPDQMAIQIHESIGHPLELDRILGDERNYAGTSFVRPEMFGAYRYGSVLLNVTYDPTLAAELASFAYDDDGTKAEKVWLIRDGVLVAPLGGTLSQLRAGLPGTANSRSSAWNRAPIDRMANLNVEPGTSTLAEMIDSISSGVLMRTNTSWSIDDARNKFQFGCEWGERIENGRLAGVVKNPNYRGISATFWRNLKLVGERASFELNGTPFCGKGEPNQMIHVGHASPACVFGGVEVFGGEA